MRPALDDAAVVIADLQSDTRHRAIRPRERVGRVRSPVVPAVAHEHAGLFGKRVVDAKTGFVLREPVRLPDEIVP